MEMMRELTNDISFLSWQQSDFKPPDINPYFSESVTEGVKVALVIQRVFEDNEWDPVELQMLYNVAFGKENIMHYVLLVA